MSQNENGAARHHTSGPANNTTPSPAANQQSTAPFVYGTAFPPAAHRSFWLVIIAPCPKCQAAHAHRTGPAGGLRRAGCDQGSYYVLPRPSLSVRRGGQAA